MNPQVKITVDKGGVERVIALGDCPEEQAEALTFMQQILPATYRLHKAITQLDTTDRSEDAIERSTCPQE